MPNNMYNEALGGDNYYLPQVQPKSKLVTFLLWWFWHATKDKAGVPVKNDLPTWIILIGILVMVIAITAIMFLLAPILFEIERNL